MDEPKPLISGAFFFFPTEKSCKLKQLSAHGFDGTHDGIGKSER
jgi:hypothetical protein